MRVAAGRTHILLRCAACRWTTEIPEAWIQEANGAPMIPFDEDDFGTEEWRARQEELATLRGGRSSVAEVGRRPLQLEISLREEE